jgi:hypothetical protein
MNGKLIVSHAGALRAKYGAAGLAAIRKAVAALVVADKARGLATKVVWLDNPQQMQAAGATPIGAAAAPRAFKAAIDVVWRKAAPAYLMLLGATDVLPHQRLRNPAYGDGEDQDEDPYAWSDLPYACEAAYSTDSARFVGPTRVVGRLPDLHGAAEPSHLLKLLALAAAHQPLPAAAYRKAFGLTAKVWAGSTRISLDELVGAAHPLHSSPPKGPSHGASVMAPRLHLINCHGNTASPEFLGEFPKETYPVAMTSRKIAGRIIEGTVAAVECCYGAELYDSVTLAGDLPICQHYLAQGACGYLGSTTVAYGGVDDSGQADLICRDFLAQVQQGASLGRALLVARQAFVKQAAQMDAVDLKTLAQFVLLGDPSLTPVAAAGGAAPATKAVAAKGARAQALSQEVQAFERAERRAALKATGQFLARSKPTASEPAPQAAVTATVGKALSNIARAVGLTGGTAFRAFAVKAGADAAKEARSAPAAKALALPTRYHLAIQRVPGAAGAPVQAAVAIVAKELDGRIVGYRVYARR